MDTMVDHVQERLLALFNNPAEEISYEMIARTLNKEFNLVLTRSAISGKILRLGLSRGKRLHGRKRVSAKRTVVHASVAVRAQRKKIAAEQLAVERAALGSTVDLGPFDGTKIQGLRTLGQLNATSCRWPFDCDDGLVRYCPNSKPDELKVPYCVTHTNLARRR
jgi:hypothetical protein